MEFKNIFTGLFSEINKPSPCTDIETVGTQTRKTKAVDFTAVYRSIGLKDLLRGLPKTKLILHRTIHSESEETETSTVEEKLPHQEHVLRRAKRALPIVMAAFEKAAKSAESEQWVCLSQVGDQIRDAHPDFFSYRSHYYGCSSLKDLIRKLPEFEWKHHRKTKTLFVRLSKNSLFKEPAAPESIAAADGIEEIKPNLTADVISIPGDTEISRALLAFPIVMDAFEKATKNNKNQIGVTLSQLGNFIRAEHPRLRYGIYGCRGLKSLIGRLAQFEMRFAEDLNATVVVLVTNKTNPETSSRDVEAPVLSESDGGNNAQDLPRVRRALPILIKAFKKAARKRDTASLSKIGYKIYTVRPTFMYRTYGCCGLEDMIRRLPEFELMRNNTLVRLRVTTCRTPVGRN